MLSRLVALRCAPATDPGILAGRLACRRIALRRVEPTAPLGTASGLIVLDRGGGAAADLALVQAAMRAGLPVLGIGAGGLAVAKALDAPIVAGGAPQFGYIDLEALPAAADDPVAAPAFPGLPLLHWHGDAMALPDGATLLLRCERGRVQAFRAGSAYAFLARLEATPELIRRWAAELARARNNPAFAIRLSGEIERHQARAQAVATAILDRWLDTVERQPPFQP